MALDMELTDLIVIITLISGIVGLIRGLLGILADFPKALENVKKGWSSFKEFLPSLQFPDVQEEAPQLPVQNTTITPPCGTLCINIFDTIPGISNDGYTTLRFRQNVSPYYYS